MSFQNRLVTHMWNRNVQRMRRDDDMRIKCLVAGSVKINDLNKEFHYGQEEIISNKEYQASRDLRNAISKGWVQVLGRYNNQQPVQNKLDINDPKQQETIQDLAKTLAKEMASEMVKEILKKMPQQTIVHQHEQVTTIEHSEIKQQKKLQAVDIEEETYVKMDIKEEEDVVTRVDLSKQSEQKSVNDDVIKQSLAKLKEIRRKKSE